MLFSFQQYQEVILTLLKMTTKTFLSPSFKVRVGRIAIGIFYPTGEPISPHRLHCSPFAVVHYNFMGHCFAAAAILTRK